jgi:hypothetical protein
MSDEEAITDLAGLREPELRNPGVVKRIRFNVKSQRDCGAAGAVGAGTLAVSLLIGGGNVGLEAFYVLVGVQAALLYAAQWFSSRSTQLMGRGLSLGSAALFVCGATAFSVPSLFLISQLRRHESNVGSPSWWWLLGLAGVEALLGLIIRRMAESLLDELDDKIWALRLDPLADQENVRKVVTDIEIFQLRLAGAFMPTPPATGEKAASTPRPEDRANSAAGTLPSPPMGGPDGTQTLITPAAPSEVRSGPPKRVPGTKARGRPRHKASAEAEQLYQADVVHAARRGELLDTARRAESQLRQAQARRAPMAEIRRLAEDLDAGLTATMQAAYAAQRAEIGPCGYEDRIFRRKAMATPRVHALTAEAERLLTLRETHRINGIPAITFEPGPTSARVDLTYSDGFVQETRLDASRARRRGSSTQMRAFCSPRSTRPSETSETLETHVVWFITQRRFEETVLGLLRPVLLDCVRAQLAT